LNFKMNKDKLKFFVDKIIDAINIKSTSGPRTFGFEYEFLSRAPFTPEDMGRLYDLLPRLGFNDCAASFESPSGVYITFEPGGQIEYHSPPILKQDIDGFNRINELILDTNRAIKERLGIDYLSTGYIPGRANTPLCLKTERYIDLHASLKESGTRGLEMMKGSASIHLHVVIFNADELPGLFARVCGISLTENFLMGRERRDIWNNTDPSRCGLPFFKFLDEKGSDYILEDYVRFVLEAHDIRAKSPFHEGPDISPDSFFRHITTIFSDVRINFKGPTVELRTLDSMSIADFGLKWKRFISLFDDII